MTHDVAPEMTMIAIAAVAHQIGIVVGVAVVQKILTIPTNVIVAVEVGGTEVTVTAVILLIVVITDADVIETDHHHDPEIDMREGETVVGIDQGLDHVPALQAIEETEILAAPEEIRVIIVEIMAFHLLQTLLYLYLV